MNTLYYDSTTRKATLLIDTLYCYEESYIIDECPVLLPGKLYIADKYPVLLPGKLLTPSTWTPSTFSTNTKDKFQTTDIGIFL